LRGACLVRPPRLAYLVDVVLGPFVESHQRLRWITLVVTAQVAGQLVQAWRRHR